MSYSVKKLGQPQVKLHRRTGPDHRVSKNDVQNLMQGKLLLPQLNEPGHKKGHINVTNNESHYLPEYNI
mgnify:FL=1